MATGKRRSEHQEQSAPAQETLDLAFEAQEAAREASEHDLVEISPDDPAVDKEMLPSFALAPATRGVLKKANEAIVMRPVRGEVAFLSRKIYNTLLYHAQQQGLADKDTFSVPRSVLCKDAGFDSKDMQLLKERLLALMSSTIEWGWVGEPEKAPNGRLWEATTLVSYAGFFMDQSTKEVWIKWSYSKELKNQLLESTQYTKLSLAIIARLRSLPALALYELASRYATSPSRVSKRATWEAWVTILRGKPIKEYPTLDYRRFKKETLIQARAQVNAEQRDFVVDFKEFKSGRRVTHLQLVVTPLHSERPAMDTRASMDISLFNKMLSFGIHQYAADAIYSSCDEDVLREALLAVDQRIRNTKIPPVQNIEAYLKQRIKTLQDVIDADERNHPEWGEFDFKDKPSQQEGQGGEGQAPGNEEEGAAGESAGPQDADASQSTGDVTSGQPKPAAAPSKSPEQSEHIQALKSAYERKKTGKAREMYSEATVEQQQAWLRLFETEYLPTAPRTLNDTYAKKGVSAPLVRVPFFKWLAEKTWTEQLSDLELFRWGVENRILKFRDE